MCEPESTWTMTNLTILYEDPDILVCEKPVGIDSQESRGFTISLTDLIKTHLAKQQQNAKHSNTNPYLGVVHRLDRPVGGVMVYAKHKQAAADLSKQVASHQFEKHYFAVVHGIPKQEDTLIDYLIHDKKTNHSFVQNLQNNTNMNIAAKKAELDYRTISTIQHKEDILTLLDIHLKTGRHHQIRVQLAHAGYPLYHDNHYNPNMKPTSANNTEKHSIGLYAYKLKFTHPTTKRMVEFNSFPSHGIFAVFDPLPLLH